MSELDVVQPADPEAFHVGRAAQIAHVQEYIADLLQSERGERLRRAGGFERDIPPSIHGGTLELIRTFDNVRSASDKFLPPSERKSYQSQVLTIARLVPGMRTNESDDRGYRIGRRSLCVLMAGAADVPDVDTAAEMIHGSRRQFVCPICPVRILCESKYNTTRQEGKVAVEPNPAVARTVDAIRAGRDASPGSSKPRRRKKE